MAGPVLDRELAAPSRTNVRFALARAEDDPALRRLLRATPMPGAISLGFEREPDYFRGCGIAGAEDRTIVAFENEHLVCMGRCSVRHRFLNGQPRRVGYLGELRLAASAQGRFDILRRGYQFFFREVFQEEPPIVWFTSIASDNHRSIRFLERNLRGMPRYDFLGEFVTVLIPVPRRRSTVNRLTSGVETKPGAEGLRCEAGSSMRIESITRLLNEQGARFQFAATWASGQLSALEPWGLPPGDWQCVLLKRGLVACAGLWDQRSFRQTVLRGFSRRMAAVRPFINLAAAVAGGAGVPAAGSTLAQGFLSPLAIASGCDEMLLPLLSTSLSVARNRGLSFLTLGFAATAPSLAILRRHFRGREYRSRLYRVSLPGCGVDAALDGRAVMPEVALL
jgi:hypothetical protein